MNDSGVSHVRSVSSSIEKLDDDLILRDSYRPIVSIVMLTKACFILIDTPSPSSSLYLQRCLFFCIDSFWRLHLENVFDRTVVSERSMNQKSSEEWEDRIEAKTHWIFAFIQGMLRPVFRSLDVLWRAEVEGSPLLSPLYHVLRIPGKLNSKLYILEFVPKDREDDVLIITPLSPRYAWSETRHHLPCSTDLDRCLFGTLTRCTL